ncbi:CHAT domain-containing protein [Kovacikia minuta CCNUW1]|uniref:CHAT domain-containing protein n=1 Tax=Kovacikia minuta TaxID=2931930 RepID=UPI001CC9F584|nr:CHAT domain-containing protein [Kovacikia minuta]UBF27676.1 CHAT domain-containing protein [Kovacikia minuta CCNUW1]
MKTAIKRFLLLLSLGIGTTLLILCLNFNPLPSAAQLTPPTGQATSPALELDQQGKTYYQKGQLEQAIAVWNQAAKSFAAQNDRPHQAMILSHLAQAYQQLGQWDQANAAIAQSLDLLKPGKSGVEGDRLRILAEAQTTQGSLQLAQGQTESALTSWQQAALTFQQAGDQVGVIRSQINQAQALMALGFYQRAAKTLEPAYSIRQTQSIPLQVAILLSYGDSLRLNGKLDPAQEVLEEGLKLARSIPSPPDITTALMGLGNIARTNQQLQSSRYTDQSNSSTAQSNPTPPRSKPDTLHSAFWYYQQAAETADPIGKIQALLNQQSLLFDLQSDRKSIDDPQVRALSAQIQALLDRLPLNRTTLYARIQLAQNLLKLQDPAATQAAVQLLETTAKQAETLGDRAAQSYALGYLGQAYEQQQQGTTARRLTTEALKLTTQALNLAQVTNSPDIAYRWLWQLGRLERDSHPQQALIAYDRAYTTLENLRQDLAADNPDLQYTFQKQPVELVYREYIELLLRPEAAPETNLKKAREIIQTLQVRELRNFLQEPCGEVNPESIDAVVNEPGSHTAVLYPIVLPNRIEVIGKLPDQPLFHYRTQKPEAEVKQAINQFQKDLQEPYTFDTVKAEGQQIYQWLIAPAQKRLADAQIKTLVFALDGPFRNIPMSALHDGQHYLIQQYAVSAVLGLELKDRKPLDKKHLTVLAASLTDPPPNFQSSFGRLTEAKQEIAEIKSVGVDITEKSDLDFTRDSFNEAINNASFEVVHLATHGQFSSNPQETFIMTAASSGSAEPGSDGIIRLNEIDKMFRTRLLNRPDVIELLILSACETASGDDRATLGIAGTAVRAGAQSAIASLWSLNDRSSVIFAEELYKKLTQPQASKAEALQAAKKALIATDQYSHPRYWAAYVLVGNWL